MGTGWYRPGAIPDRLVFLLTFHKFPRSTLMASLLHALRAIEWAKLPPWLSVIAVISTAYFATRAGRKQRRIALFDRRLEVFDAALELIGTVIRTGKVKSDDFQKFLWKKRECDLLFNSGISTYLNELSRKAREVYALEGAVDEIPKRDRREALLWFSEQGDVTRKKFSKYIAFREA